MRYGHVKISRRTFDPVEGDEFWLERREFSRFEAWVDLIQMAAWKDFKRIVNRHEETIQRGELCVSIRFLATRWQWGIKRVRIFLETLENAARMRAQRETPVGTLYRIVNYERYQTPNAVEDTPTDTPEGTDGAQRGHSEGTKKKQLNSKTDKASLLADREDVRSVLEVYRQLHPKRRPGEKDARAVARAIDTLGYTPAEVEEAIRGNAADPWHREKRKHELAYVLRDNGKIDDFRARAEPAPPYTGSEVVDGWFSPEVDRLTAPRTA